MTVSRKIFKTSKQFWYKRHEGIIQINRNKYKMNPEITKDDHLKFGKLDTVSCGFGHIY